MKVAYIAMPYRAAHPRGIIENIRRAEEIAIRYWKKEYAVICPHLNSALFDGILPDSKWLEGYISILAKCDVCVMGPGWKDSEGAKTEYKYAKENNIKIIYE